MRLAISNIAWDIGEDVLVAELLQRFNIDAIDVVPGKYFPEFAKAKDSEVRKIKEWWFERGIEITGMQSLLFGTVGLNLFGPPHVQEILLAHFKEVCRIAARLGANRVVFGSPKNRDRSGLTDQTAMELAIPFFRRLADIAESYEVVICLEPNPQEYGANFMTNSSETVTVVDAVDHRAIRMQLDTGAITLNQEDVDSVLKTHANLIGHVHISEPHLVPLGDGKTDHSKMYKALLQHFPSHVISIEMLATQNEPHLVAIERALAFTRWVYGFSELYPFMR